MNSPPGIINGIGSIGAVFSGWMTATVSSLFGWPALYAILAVAMFSGGALLLKPAHREV